MGVGTRLKIALNEYGLTVAELSRKTGISTNTLYAMIRRDNQKIDPSVLKKICENSDITVYDLLENCEDYAVKYLDPSSSKEEQEIGDYVLTKIGNDDQLVEIIEIYDKLNDKGKSVACERVKELSEIDRYVVNGLENVRKNLKPKNLKFPDQPDNSTDNDQNVKKKK